ncbi:hypothetical protein MMC07_004370 [Pseudocyphellaria aurata]|nr:hypothetical protein [Pseudocyphellaria aurata]
MGDAGKHPPTREVLEKEKKRVSKEIIQEKEEKEAAPELNLDEANQLAKAKQDSFL